jgi:hypothetical protein
MENTEKNTNKAAEGYQFIDINERYNI